MSVDELVANIEKTDFADIVQAGGPELQVLLNLATTVFEEFHAATQATALALMLGMLLGSIEGLTVDMERDENVIITFEDRLRIFLAQTRIAFAAAYAEGKNAPGSPGVM